MRESIEHRDLVEFATRRGGVVLCTEYRGVAVLHRWRCGRDHEFEASPRLLIHGGYWCPTCAPTVDDTSGWDWEDQSAHDPLIAAFHRRPGS